MQSPAPIREYSLCSEWRLIKRLTDATHTHTAQGTLQERCQKVCKSQRSRRTTAEKLSSGHARSLLSWDHSSCCYLNKIYRRSIQLALHHVGGHTKPHPTWEAIHSYWLLVGCLWSRGWPYIHAHMGISNWIQWHKIAKWKRKTFTSGSILSMLSLHC